MFGFGAGTADHRRYAYRRTFDWLIEHIEEKPACRLMVDLLALAHDRGCEAELASALADDRAADRQPDIKALRGRFAPDPAALPEGVVRLMRLDTYEELLGGDTGEAS